MDVLRLPIGVVKTDELDDETDELDVVLPKLPLMLLDAEPVDDEPELLVEIPVRVDVLKTELEGSPLVEIEVESWELLIPTLDERDVDDMELLVLVVMAALYAETSTAALDCPENTLWKPDLK
ncbi:hypothetical protein LTR78_006984 [Recurvomyces mirabilis]|uniref:Uncharacterized protein n=1 Tax=Recurvomyces mirabilis TaxID=574656 RepID=A0AAE1BZ29_9PEZI|nr:hypothetical protein LTR78_006984 [Recurvomyces mirabilis]KAK5153368.1 hypothetical protein LTS14_007537 [Recurvomyces mirabilis]